MCRRKGVNSDKNIILVKAGFKKEAIFEHKYHSTDKNNALKVLDRLIAHKKERESSSSTESIRVIPKENNEI